MMLIRVVPIYKDKLPRGIFPFKGPNRLTFFAGKVGGGQGGSKGRMEHVKFNQDRRKSYLMFPLRFSFIIVLAGGAGGGKKEQPPVLSGNSISPFYSSQPSSCPTCTKSR